jgi:hypothetical protein
VVCLLLPNTIFRYDINRNSIGINYDRTIWRLVNFATDLENRDT